MATTTDEAQLDNVPAAAELAEGSAVPVEGSPCQGTSSETIIVEETGVSGKRPHATDDAAEGTNDAKRAKTDSSGGELSQFTSPMDALVTLAGDQQQLVVQEHAANTTQMFEGTQVIESIADLGNATTSANDIAAQVVAGGFATVVTTSADVQTMAASNTSSETLPGAEMTVSAIGTDDGSTGQITLVAINPEEPGTPVTPSHQRGQQPEIINQCWFSPKDEKDNPQGIKWKSGMWSKQENEILKRNIEEYLKTNNIASAEEVIFELSKEERKDFYRTIARGITRPLFAVYRRVLRMYDKKNYLGKYSPIEVDKLKELKVKHGNDWAAIGAAMNRSASSVKDRCRLMREGGNSGKWTEEEERHLSQAVHDITNTKVGEYVTCSLPWAQVADKVGTRTEKQCRSKWLNFLNWKEAGGIEWKKRDEVELIDRIYVLNLDDENEIDWTTLSHGWKAVRSPQWLRSKWWALKRHVPDPHNMSFRSIIDFLHNNHASLLRNKVEKHDSRPRLATMSMSQSQQPQQQQTVMAVPLVSFQGSHGQTFSLPGKGQVTMVPVAVSQSGMTSSGTTAVIVNPSDLSSTGGISLEALLGQQVGDGQPQAFILQTSSGGGMGQQTILLQSSQIDQGGEQTVITAVPAATDAEVNLPGATPVEGDGSQLSAAGGDSSIVVTEGFTAAGNQDAAMVIDQGKQQDMDPVVIAQDGADVPIVGEEVTTATSILDSSTVEVISSAQTADVPASGTE